MGFYVNPNDRSKKAFLIGRGVVVPGRTLDWSAVPKGSLPVVHMDNGYFDAAGIAYNEAELKAFTMPDDKRPRTIYIVKIEDLLTVAGPDFARWYASQTEDVGV